MTKIGQSLCFSFWMKFCGWNSITGVAVKSQHLLETALCKVLIVHISNALGFTVITELKESHCNTGINW